MVGDLGKRGVPSKGDKNMTERHERDDDSVLLEVR